MREMEKNYKVKKDGMKNEDECERNGDVYWSASIEHLPDPSGRIA